MISHMNIVCLVNSLSGTGIVLETWDIHISYLPLAHTFERIIMSGSYMIGYSVGFYNGNILQLKDDLLKLRPTLFASVPRLYNKLYVGIRQRLSQAGWCKRALTHKAIRDKLANYHVDGTVTHSLWDKLIFRVFRQGLGGNVRYMLTASAPIKAEVLDFLKVCFCVPILEGYGQTETAAVTLTRPQDKDTGTVGGPLECCEIKLKDVPYLNYLHTNKPNPRGEICIRGNNLCEGYFRAHELNEETFDEDGWALSGDIGEFLPNGSLKIIDRKKHIFKLSQGEYIAPEKLENTFVQCLLLKNIFIYGDSLQDFIVAIIVPEKDELDKWAVNELIEYDDYSEFIKSDQVKKHILNLLAEFKASSGLNSLEIPKTVYVHDEEFTVENGLLTPTFKLKRAEAKNYFLKEIKNMYGGAVFQGE
jgi:long-chain acyl-CoA synthetase